MGLLDSLMMGSQGGYGGLLDALMYRSPLQNQGEAPQPQYDPMGNYTGVTPQSAPDPFGPVPGLAQWAQQFAPASPFTGTAPAAPVQQFAGVPVLPQSAQPPQPAPQEQPGRTMDIGGYQMPQIGSAADYTPQATDFSSQNRQQQAPQAPALPPAFGQPQGGDFAGNALTGLQSFLNGGGLISSIRAASNGQRSDPQGVAQQNLKAQYDTLVPLLGPQKAMLAVMNPEAGKTLLAQALEKKKYEFTKLDDNTIVANDPTSGKSSISYGGERSNTMTGPDGKTLTMPDGADPKTWRNEITKINADVAAGKKTEVQAKAEIFANKMEQSNKSITDGVGTSLAGKIASGLPLGNYAQSQEYQKYKQASSNFITALLRQESGAAISKSEFDRYEREYMPQPGDGPDVLAQKSEARRVAIDGMKKGAGPSYKSPTSAPAGVRVYNPTTGKIE